MSLEKQVNLPTPSELQKELPLTPFISNEIAIQRETVRSILNKEESRLLLIVGPCSIHDTTAAIEFASRLSALQKIVEKEIYLVMRVYCEKPRTLSKWKGLLYDPDLDESHQVAKGLYLTRKVMRQIQEMGVSICTEFLDPFTYPYYQDLVTLGCIGARTATSQIHRQLAAHLPLPFAFKNPIDGDLHLAIQSMLAAGATQPHICLNLQGQASVVQARGNSDTVLVLRGNLQSSNYDPESLEEAGRLLRKNRLPERLIIDCSHDNSRRNPLMQTQVFEAILQEFIGRKGSIVGLMLESHLQGGQQDLRGDKELLNYGQSITDACLSWEETEELILKAFQSLHYQKEEALSIT